MEPEPIEGLEPEVNPKNPCELTWGTWTIEARASVSSFRDSQVYPVDLTYLVEIDYCGDSDSGTENLFGKLSTSGSHSSLESAAESAKRMKPQLFSTHCEKGDEDWVDYYKTIDVSAIVDAACLQLKSALQNSGFKDA